MKFSNRYQHGINMVDLMMWLVIASLMLATAIQAITYYQQATYAYHAKSDLAGSHTWVSATHALNSKLPTLDDMEESLLNGDLTLTTVGGESNIGLFASSNQKYCVGVKSPHINDLTKNVFYSTSDDPSNVLRGTSIPETCGTVIPFAPIGTDTSGAITPVAPVVVGTATDLPPKGDFTWNVVPGATGYKVEKQVNTGTWEVVTPDQPETSVSISSPEGDIVSVRVTAINNVGTSPLSNVAIVTIPSSVPNAYAAWGKNSDSQLNDGTTIRAALPAGMLNSGGLAGKKISYVNSGLDYACALTTTAEVFCWGDGGNGELGTGNSGIVPTPTKINMTAIGTRTITQLSVGQYHSCVVASGEAFCWGYNANGRLGRGFDGGRYNTPAVVGGDLIGKTVTSVVANHDFTCAVADARAYCWGNNTYGQVKGGSGGAIFSPFAIDTSGALKDVNITQVAPGNLFACALGDGKVYCWAGQGGLVFGAAPVQIDPTGILSGKTISVLDSGTSHACVLADGKPYCWGGNGRGQLGDGSTYDSLKPVNTDPYGVFDGRTVTSLSAGVESSCAVASGKVYCWGENTSNQIGDGTTNFRTVPTPVNTTTALAGKTAKTVFVGGLNAYAGYDNSPPVVPTRPIFSDPSFNTAGWGLNSDGKVGVGDGGTASILAPVSVLNSGSLAGKKVTQVESSSYHSCAIAEGAVHCWGDNYYGQMGNLDVASSKVPVPVFIDGWLRNKKVTDLTLGEIHSCVIADGKVYCWGNNSMGQTGTGARSWNYRAPVLVGGTELAGKNITAIDAGHRITCAVADGKAYCWGYNVEGQLGNGDATRTTQFFPVAVKTDGVLNGKTVTEISATTTNACVIADGKMYCWGYNYQGQLGVVMAPMTTDVPIAVSTASALGGKTITAIATGDYHSCAIADGKMHCWGNNASGELGLGTNTGRINDPSATSGALANKDISMMGIAGGNTCALTTAGEVYCWGIGNNGRNGNGLTTSVNTPTRIITTGVLNSVSVSKLWVGSSSGFVGY